MVVGSEEFCVWLKTDAQSKLTDGTSEVWLDDHTRHTVFPNTEINNGNERELHFAYFGPVTIATVRILFN